MSFKSRTWKFFQNQCEMNKNLVTNMKSHQKDPPTPRLYIDVRFLHFSEWLNSTEKTGHGKHAVKARTNGKNGPFVHFCPLFGSTLNLSWAGNQSKTVQTMGPVLLCNLVSCYSMNQVVQLLAQVRYKTEIDQYIFFFW